MDELARLQQELQQVNEKYLRAAADFENAKKRLVREKEEFTKYASESVIRELLPILDGLDQALVAVDKQSDPDAVVRGVHLIYRQLLGVLGKEGVKRIPTVGEPFDPQRHEAVGHVEPSNGIPEGAVAEEVHAGYTMHGHVIRPAIVKVAGSQPSTSESASAESEGDISNG